MTEKWRDHYFNPQDIAFHLASSDRELVDKVSNIMKRSGHLSFSDSMGKEHYIIDGRRGIPTLTQHINQLTHRIISKNQDPYEHMRPYFSAAIDSVLDMSGIPSSLKGYRYVKYILFRVIEDDSLISPLSKTVYPDLCEIYNCTTFQIERDIRYSVMKSRFYKSRLSPKMFICTLLEFANRLANDMVSRDASIFAEYSDCVEKDPVSTLHNEDETTPSEAKNVEPFSANRDHKHIPFIHPYPCEIDYMRFDQLIDKG